MHTAIDCMVDHEYIGDPTGFAFGYAFLDDGDTEVVMCVDGVNVLGFTKAGSHRTLRWSPLDGLVSWLRRFALTMGEDPYPVGDGRGFAAQRDAEARTFESDDLDVLDAYYGPLLDWADRHAWAGECGGAVLSNVFFELRGGSVEISWDNRRPGEGVEFDCVLGGAAVDAEAFKQTGIEFADAYDRHWGAADAGGAR